MPKTKFDDHAKPRNHVEKTIQVFLDKTPTLEEQENMPVIIFQDGVNGSYYIRCSLKAKVAKDLCDLNAKLDWDKAESFRANRELLKKNQTYKKMADDAADGREFNDIIVEFNNQYELARPLKVWGGQHRISSIMEKGTKNNRYHGFKIYFHLEKEQRTEVALISNTNINVSNDTFDRMVEETNFGDQLVDWCRKVGLIEKSQTFPDVGSRSELMTVKLARDFIVNFYLGKERGTKITERELDLNVYEPQVVKSGVDLDPLYAKFMERRKILNDQALVEAGKNFATLHRVQYKSVTEAKKGIKNNKSYRNKALIESVLCGWAYVAGLLQAHPTRLKNHYQNPKTTTKIPDPLNAREMSEFKHDQDPKTYRGLGTRSSVKDRQRLAQLFLAKSIESKVVIDKAFMNKAVSQVVGLISLQKGYSKSG